MTRRRPPAHPPPEQLDPACDGCRGGPSENEDAGHTMHTVILWTAAM